MTDPYARPAGDDGDLTVPIVPESGYAQPHQPPYAEETLVDPLAPSPWAGSSAQDFGYTPTPGLNAPSGAGSGRASSAPAVQGYPSASDYWRAPGSAQPSVPASGQAPPPSTYAQPQSNYVQPQVGYTQPQPGYAASGQWQAQPADAGFAEPPAQTNPAFQPYPQAGPSQPQQWPAVMPDPVGYDYGYNRPNFAQSEHPNAIPALILGIIGVVLFPLAAPVAWYLGAKGQREVRYDPGRWRSSGSLTAGKILGIIGTAFMGLIVLFFIFIFGLAMLAAG